MVLTDGVVVLRPPRPEDTSALVVTRDGQFRRFLGEGSPDPQPTFCTTVDGRIVGWVDYDHDERSWLAGDEVNCGYALAPDARGRGLATRSVMLLLHHLAQTRQDIRTATLAIDHDNVSSLAIARRCGFTRAEDLPSSTLWKKPVPPLTYTDGVVAIRRPEHDDGDAHLATIDDVQIDWLWEPGHREAWEAMTAAEQLAHQRRHMRRMHDEFGRGPKWTFAVVVDGEYAGHVDADLANPHVPAGDANISYSMAPWHRGRGYVSRAVRLVLQFLTEHTGAREAHIVVHPGNVASLRVAGAVGARETARVDHHGQTMVRHVVGLRGATS